MIRVETLWPLSTQGQCAHVSAQAPVHEPPQCPEDRVQGVVLTKEQCCLQLW